MEYYLITGLDEGVEIAPFAVAGLEAREMALSVADRGFDKARWYETITAEEYRKYKKGK